MNEREAYSAAHPPACTCVACVERRRRPPEGLWPRLLRLLRLRR